VNALRTLEPWLAGWLACDGAIVAAAAARDFGRGRPGPKSHASGVRSGGRLGVPRRYFPRESRDQARFN
jgi:hypothetical protein